MSLTAHRVLQYIALILIFTAMAGGYWYWRSQAAVRINQGLEDSLEQGLVGYWKLDDASGTTATDSSGNGNNGTLTNGPTWSTGQVGGAVTFDGVDDYITTSDIPFGGTTSITVCAWANFDNVSNNHTIIAQGSEIVLRSNTNSIEFILNGFTTNDRITVVSAVTAGVWQHICGTYESGKNLSVYVNAVKLGSVVPSGSYADIASPFILGYLTSSGEYMDGSLDETHIYNRPLSDEEVKKLYQTTAPTGIDTGLVGYWPFDGDDISGTTTSDRSGKGNHGTITSGTTKTLGKAGQALDFSAGNGVQIDSLTQTGQTYTFATWAKLTDTSTMYIFDTSDGRLVLDGGYQTSTARSISYYDGTWKSVGSANSIPLNEWVHLVWVLNSSSGIATGYINGVSVGTNSYVGTNIGTNTRIGSYFGGGAGVTQGALDDFRIYNRALTAADVQDLYQKTQSDTVGASNKRDSLALGLAGYWKLDDASGTTATDSSTNGNNGTLTNGPTWGTGQIQGAANFDGVNDYITANRATNSNVFTYAAWVRWTSGTDGTVIGTTFGGTQFRIINSSGLGSLNLLAAGVVDIGSSVNKIAGGIWNHVVVTNDAAGNYKFYINGADAGGSGNHVYSYAASPGIAIGARYYDSGSENFTGLIDETRIYDRVLTADEISRLYRTTAPTGVDTGLKGYWSFDGDDISGTTATDLSGAGNHGTLTGGPTKTIGKMAQALNFDGVNDSISINDHSSLRLPLGGQMSIDVWYKSNMSSGAGVIYSKASGGGDSYTLNLLGGASSHTLAFYYRSYNGSAIAGIDNVQISGIEKDVWHHVSSSYDMSTGIFNAYVDGVLAKTVTVAPNSAIAGSNFLYIGGAGRQHRPGPIDELRIYNRILSVDEVREEYDYGKADKINTAGSDPLADGLAGYWKLDETSGTTMADGSGNGNNGTLTNGPTWTTAGQVSGALSFDGVDDYATVPYSSSLVGTDKLSYSFWIKPDLNEGAGILGALNGEDSTGYGFMIIDNNGTQLNNPVIDIYRNIGGTSTNRAASFPSSTNTWIHGVYTYDGTAECWYINGSKRGEWAQTGAFATNTEAGLFLGMPYSTAPGYKGLIDEVRVYKRALTAEDVQKLYRTTAPTGVDTSLVGYWPFDGDDFSGTTTYDRSGKGNNGTLTNGPTKTIGKIGQSLGFDGVDDYVITNHLAALNAYPITVSTWVRTGVNDATRRYILNKYNFPNGYAINLLNGKIRTWYLTGNGGTNYVYDGSEGMSSKAVVSDNQWHLVTFTVDTAGGKLYIDGTLEDSMAWTGTPQATSNTEGVRWSAVVTGGTKISASLDETRIYNRALTAAEIQNLYLKGH